MRFGLSFGFAFAASVLATPLAHRADLSPPSHDSFYYPGAGWKDEAPGTILRSRKVDAAFLTIPLKVTAYELLYRTSGTSPKQKAHSVTTILIPEKAKRDQLVSYQTYIDAAGPQCAPSYNIRKDSKFGTDLFFQIQVLMMETLLQRGYVLSVPDYQGLNETFAAAHLEGYQVIDSIRAALSFDKLGFSKDAKVVGYGYSGGAIATGWAASLQPTYAPDLPAVGWSMGGTPANLTSTVENLNGSIFSGFGVAGVVGLYTAYPGIKERFTPDITPEGHEALDYASTHCMLDILIKFPLAPLLTDKYVRGGARLLYDPAVTKYTDTFNMGTEKKWKPSAPVFMFHGKNDEAIPYGPARDAARRFGNIGADITFLTVTDFYAEHLVTEVVNNANVVFFIEDRFAGKSFPKGLKMESVGNPLVDPRIAAEGLESLVNAIKGVVDNKIGQGDSKVKKTDREPHSSAGKAPTMFHGLRVNAFRAAARQLHYSTPRIQKVPNAFSPTTYTAIDDLSWDNIQQRLSQSILSEFPVEEAKLRIELAAAYRLFGYFNWNDDVVNHLTAGVKQPDGSVAFLINPYGLRYDEITASSLLKISADGELLHPGVVGDLFRVNKAGFVIHSAIHTSKHESAAAVMHCHHPLATGLACTNDGFIPSLSQNAAILGAPGYHEFRGIVVDEAEKKDLVHNLGEGNILFMRNHGIITTGESIGGAWYRMYILLRAAQTQGIAQASAGHGGGLLQPAPEAVVKTFEIAKTFTGRQFGQMEFSAYQRLMDKLDPTYRN
ncbi:hypothetical protein MSPP1_002614 [Malassezia sp. CBS 17886]|nr:hypothetical protein MSPP1_002614 [Malassezia sp. CBS 17886]